MAALWTNAFAWLAEGLVETGTSAEPVGETVEDADVRTREPACQQPCYGKLSLDRAKS
jgi:hypothetical protein